MRRMLLIAVWLSVAIGVAFVSARSTTVPASPTDVAETKRPELDKIISVTFKDTPLKEAIASIRAQTQVNLVVDWRDLESGGIDSASPVNLEVSNCPASQVLDLVLKEAGAGTVKLGYRCEGAIVHVMTEESFAKDLMIRVYDVSDLLERQHKRRLAQRPHGGASDGADRLPNNPPSADYSQSIQDLQKIIQDVIVPDTWRENGGSFGSIDEFDHMFVITQTADGHRQIVDLLQKLRSGGEK